VIAGKRPRAHGPENCKCFPEVRRSATDALIGLPSLAQTSPTESAVHALPESIFLVFPYTFLGVRVDAPPCSFCDNGLGRNPLFFTLPAEFLLLSSGSSVSELSPKSDNRINRF
jgi:hypothetical protein